MITKTLNKPKIKIIDQINPSKEKLTLEEYRSEMQSAENSDFIGFEEHKKNMNQWLTAKLQIRAIPFSLIQIFKTDFWTTLINYQTLNATYCSEVEFQTFVELKRWQSA